MFCLCFFRSEGAGALCDATWRKTCILLYAKVQDTIEGSDFWSVEVGQFTLEICKKCYVFIF